MDIWDTNKLILFLAFVIPGFVSIKLYSLIYPSAPVDSDKRLIDAVAYSSINYALLFWPIYLVESSNLRQSNQNLYTAFYVVVLLIAPILWVVLLTWLRTMDWFQRWVPHPTERAWDYVFGKRNTNWIVVTLKDGSRVGGLYGSNSFASSSPVPQQIYLEKSWEVNDDGGLEREHVDTAGVLIVQADILKIQFYKYSSGEQDGDQQRHQ